MLSTLIAPDIVEYLDTGKIGARSVAGERIIFARPGARARILGRTRTRRRRGPETALSRSAASRCAEHEAFGGRCRPGAPHGQRFIVATSWKRAGEDGFAFDPGRY